MKKKYPKGRVKFLIAFLNKSFLTLFTISLFYSTHIFAQTYPVPSNQDTTAFGRNISRTFHLLASSTPSQRNTVKILVYGQSISKQDWWLSVKKDLEQRFPNADITMENKAIGGFAANLLRRPMVHDALAFYPDLIIFHDFGGENDFEYIVSEIRKNTTAEMAIQNDHLTPGQTPWEEYRSYALLPSVAKKYGLEMMDIRIQWARYLTYNRLKSSDLLSDGVHLNDHGNFLLASLIKRHLAYKPKYPSDPFGLVTTYEVGKDVFFENGKLTLPFQGNKVEVLATSTNNPVSAEVRIDGKKPSQFQEAYAITRPNQDPKKDWPWEMGTIIKVGNVKPIQLEDWTATITQINAKKDTFSFKVAGSLTGPDGNGTSYQNFVSNSGRVTIDAQDWFIEPAVNSVYKPVINSGHQVKWSVIPMFTDLYTAPPIADNSRQYITTLIQGISNANHYLELTASGTGNIPIKFIRIYRPRPLAVISSDTLAPTAPAALILTLENNAKSSTLKWTPSSDNVGVVSYDVYDGSVKVNSSDITTTSFTLPGLSKKKTYSFTVRARDAAGNVSSNSSIATPR